MRNNTQNIFEVALFKILTSLVKIFIRNGLSYKDFCEKAKWVFVHVAATEGKLPFKKISHSRISTLTGIARKDIQMLMKQDSYVKKGSRDYNHAARVISGWLQDPYFADEHGNPAKLELNKGDYSFKELVRKYSSEVTDRSILDELARVGAIKMDNEDRICLVTHGYIPFKDDNAKMELMGDDISNHVNTFYHNMKSPPEESYLQLKVSQENFPIAVLPKLRNIAKKEGSSFLHHLDSWMSTYGNADQKTTETKRAGIGLYYFEEDDDEHDH